jgi:hypothetical protein
LEIKEFIGKTLLIRTRFFVFSFGIAGNGNWLRLLEYEHGAWADIPKLLS